MSEVYPDLSYTNYPNQADTFDYMTDVSLELLPYIKQYQTLYSSSELDKAAQLLEAHPEINNALINAEKINKLIDATKAGQRFYLEDVHKYIENIISYKGNYSEKTKYNKYDLVIYNQFGYLCISSNCALGTTPIDTNYWVAMTLKGEQGVAGLGLSFNGVWASTSNYNKDSAVTYANCLYASKIDNNKAKTPSKTSSYWNLIFDLSVTTSYDNSKSGSTQVTMQGAIDDLYSKTSTNTTKLTSIESGAQKNTITGIKGSNESSYRTGNVNITKDNIGLGNVDNTADANKSVNYAASSNYANTAGSATNATNATNANYANGAGNSDTVDGFHFTVSTSDLVPNSSPLTTNLFYFVYE